jgi:transcriptional regulator with XRE-family HTH domain
MTGGNHEGFSVNDNPALQLVAGLARQRRDLRIPQAVVAGDLGISQTALSYWETGRRSVTLTDFLRWVAALARRSHTDTDVALARTTTILLAVASTQLRG